MGFVTFLHPDLGIGGAERLVVDAALGLKQAGHSVEIVTSHYDEAHSFEETRNGQLKITIVGDWIPRNIFHRFHALMAYVQMVYAALYIVFWSEQSPDVIICDQVSIAIPILKFKTKSVIFYCHYPDQLLSKPGNLMKCMYRAPLNWLEEKTIGQASHVFVNSQYTAGVFKNTFQTIKQVPDILYPSLNTNFFDSILKKQETVRIAGTVNNDSIVILSINRYEQKKNLSLAVHAFHQLKKTIRNNDWVKLHLILAGGYDPRVMENVQYFEHLVDLSVKLELDGKITFLKSPTDYQKILLLKACLCLLYTPSNEHFGIVPVEAMYMGKPVIAVNNGGPTETVVHNQTGILCEATPEAFASALSKLIADKQLAKNLGEAGKQRVISTFSFQKFSSSLDNVVNQLMNYNKRD